MIVAVYPYTDENGVVLYESVRREPKSFFFRRPDGNGGHVNSLKDVKPVVFNLPNVKAAIGKRETIFIVEGEKDVLNLEKVGLTATCNHGGACKWKETHSKFWFFRLSCV